MQISQNPRWSSWIWRSAVMEYSHITERSPARFRLGGRDPDIRIGCQLFLTLPCQGQYQVYVFYPSRCADTGCFVNDFLRMAHGGSAEPYVQ